MTGVVTAALVLRFVLDVPVTWEPVPVGVALVVTVALAVAVGCLGTFRLLGRKPLPVLRGE